MSASKKIVKRGRPAKSPTERKRNNVTTRVRDETKHLLQQSSRASGRSISEEIEFRLEQSFRDEEAKYNDFGGEIPYRSCQIFIAIAKIVEEESGKLWSKDKDTFLIASNAWINFFSTALGTTNQKIEDFSKLLGRDMEEQVAKTGKEFGSRLIQNYRNLKGD
ncbi:MAG: TraY domain-containing protein [Rhodospirillales bacterium]|nr:TraY domain-containing protein [Rhodospirillales bacterium]